MPAKQKSQGLGPLAGLNVLDTMLLDFSCNVVKKQKIVKYIFSRPWRSLALAGEKCKS